MANVGTGNLVLQDDDMSIPHKGIALAFRRTYNSQSLHDVYGDDGAPGMYGNGWTSTFDAHLSGTSSAINVWDIDGAEYTYTFASGTWQPPAGQHATLTSDGACGYLWTKKSGTTYYFWAPYQLSTCTTSYTTYGGYAGRLSQIIGRNRNVTLSLAYSWDNGISTSAGKISDIVVTTESGLTANLGFADANDYRLLQTLTFPDNATTVNYGYDNDGDLITISHPSNNAAGTRPTQLLNYQRVGANLLINFIASPKTDVACGTSGGCYSDGGGLLFTFSGATAPTSTVTSIQQAGLVNPTIPDNTNAGPLQGTAYSKYVFTYNTEYFTTGVLKPTFSDSDGHMTEWSVDTSGRPLKTQECTASASQGTLCTGSWLVTSENWDNNNNLVSEVDPRGYETDYDYDPSGNTVAVGQPLVTAATSSGNATFRPTQLFDYDSSNNLIAACDQKASNAGHGDWTSSGPPTSGAPDSLCGSNGSSVHSVFTYATTAAEPYGELTTIQLPLGYRRYIGYSPSQQGGAIDYGLPTSVTGDAVTQSDGSRTPFQSLTYDASGRLVCSMVAGSDSTTTTILVNDVLGRVTKIGDPDDSTLTNASCSKQPGIAGSAIVSTKTYFADGSVASSQTPAEAAAAVSTQYQYDLDGDETSEVHHYTGTPAMTTKWYDGADRLVEVQQPTDPADFYTFPWTTRYLYDLTEGGTVTVATSSAYRPYGGLYKTQEFLPTGVPNPQWNVAGSAAGPSTGTGNPSWQDTAGTATDGLDRPVTQYRYTGSSLITVTDTYDATGSAGLLSQRCNANNECQSYSYDARGANAQATFNVSSSSSQTFGHDEDGRIASAANSVGSITDSYDADGRKSIRTEVVGAQSGTIGYAYYGDGVRSSVSITTPAQVLSSALAYTYSPAGLVRSLTVNGASSFAFSYTGGRRLTSRSDNTGQSADTFTYSNPNVSPTSYGLAQAINAPGFYETGMTYNSGGLQLAGSVYSWNNSAFYPSTGINNVYSSRDELATSSGGTLLANGVQIQESLGIPPPPTAFYQFNAFQGYPVQSDSANSCASPCQNDSGARYQYDVVGRQTTSTPTKAGALGFPNTKAYDAEDHLLGETMPSIPSGEKYIGYAQALGYKWGPFGHPLQVGSTSAVANPSGNTPMPTDFQYDSLFWDDNNVLFTLNTAGNIDDLKVADFADYVPGATAPLTVWDRDTGGQVRGCHSSSGKGAATSSAFQTHKMLCPGTASSFISPSFGLTTTAVGRGGMLIIEKSDGFSDGTNTFQGVRTFDPQAGVWTTPDAYAGDVHDPMSQKPYIWDHNNPYQYSDPTGLDTIVAGARIAIPIESYGRDILPFVHLFVAVFHDDGTITTYSFGPKDANSPLGSPLVRQSQDYDMKYVTTDTYGVSITPLGNCKGTCTLVDGGFDEASLERSSKKIDANRAHYGFPGPNSNSAFHYLCVMGGGGFACDHPNTGDRPAPGLGQPVTDPPAQTPPDSLPDPM